MMAENDPDKVDPEVEEVAFESTEPTSTGETATTNNRFHVPHLEEQQIPLVGYAFASFVFMVASLAQEDALRFGPTDWFGYAVSVGVLGMFFAGLCLVLLKYGPETANSQTYLSYFLLTWSMIAACLLTFGKTPFQVTGNGYFSVWAMVIFAIQHCGVTQEAARKQVTGASSTAGLGIAAIILVAAISVEVNVGDYNGRTVFGLVLSCLTILLVGAVLYLERAPEKGIELVVLFYLFIVFAVMWIVMACLLTFQGPFTVTGNGYFASWAGACLSIFATLNARQKMNAGQPLS